MPKYFHLKTTGFPIIFYEDDNGFNGAEIGNHIRNKLIEKGYNPYSIMEEDWGWWIGLRDSDNIGIYCLEDYVIANLGKEMSFSWKKLKKVKSKQFEKLNQDLADILENDPNITLTSISDEI